MVNNTLFSKLRTRKPGSKRNQKEQSVIRFLIVLLVVAYVDGKYLLSITLDDVSLVGQLVPIGLVLFSGLLVVLAFMLPQWNATQVGLSVAFDAVIIAIGIYQAGHNGIILYPIYFMVIFGYGARYGNRYLVIATSLSILGFLTVTQLHTYWHDKTALTTSLLMGLVMVSAYSAVLFRRMRNAYEEADQANRNKSNFVANIGHEFRTPLNAIIGYSEMLIENANDNNQTEDIEDLGRIRQSGLHLLALVNNLMDLSKIEAGKLELSIKEFSLLELVDEVVAVAQPLVAKNRNKLTVNTDGAPQSLTSDPFRIKQCLFNLLSNAAKFTRDGHITLTINPATGVHPDSFAITVADTGIGIPESELHQLFEAYQRAGRPSEQFEGTGLGLAITRRLAHLLGGDIEAKSAIGKGSVFTLVLPMVAQATQT